MLPFITIHQKFTKVALKGHEMKSAIW